MNPKAKKKKVFHILDIKSLWYFVLYLSQLGDFLIIACQTCTSKTENQIHKEGPPAEIGSNYYLKWGKKSHLLPS